MLDLRNEQLWTGALRNYIENGPLMAQVENNLINLNSKLPTEKQLDALQIRSVLDEIKMRSNYAQSRIRGEPADVVNTEDEVLGTTEIGLAHMLGLRHRTANAFVITPAGKLICQRCVHNKRFPLYLSIYGGHVIAPLDYEAAIRDELEGELRLAPKGEFVFLGKDFYEEPGDLNVEIRSLYLYRLPLEEYDLVIEFGQYIESKKAQMTLEEFKTWLEGEQKNKSGHGEIWGVYEVEIESLVGSHCCETYDHDIGKTIKLHYIKITDSFADQLKEDKAYFTPDLLEKTIRNPDITEALRNG